MFKYNKKPDGSPFSSSPYGENDAPAEWPGSVQQTPGVPAIDGGFVDEVDDGNSPFPIGTGAVVPSTTRNVLNYDVSVVGTLRFTDDLLVDGSVEGEITSDGELTVGANASIQAGEKNKVAVRTHSAIIHGKVTGDIVVTDRVVLAGSAEVLGDVTAAKISIEEGAVFVGMCRVGSPAVLPVTTTEAPAKKSGGRVAKGDDANLLG